MEIKDVSFFDVETTGLIPGKAEWETDFKLFPDLVQIGWIVNDVEKMYIIKPKGWVIPQEATEIHGITTEIAIEKGVDFEVVAAELFQDLNDSALICAHNIYFDTSVLKANVLKHLGREFYDLKFVENALHKSKRIDTMRKTIKFVSAPYPSGRPGVKFPSLEELYAKCFDGEKFQAHDALEDCRALKKLLPILVEMGLVKLEVKTYSEDYDSKYQKKDKKTTDKAPEIKKGKIVKRNNIAAGQSWPSGDAANDLIDSSF